MSLGRTMWWKMGERSGIVEYNCVIHFELTLIGEWWIMDSGGRRENYCVSLDAS